MHCSKVAARLATRPPSVRPSRRQSPFLLKPRADVAAVIVVVAAAVGSVTRSFLSLAWRGGVG